MLWHKRTFPCQPTDVPFKQRHFFRIRIMARNMRQNGGLMTQRWNETKATFYPRFAWVGRGPRSRSQQSSFMLRLCCVLLGIDWLVGWAFLFPFYPSFRWTISDTPPGVFSWSAISRNLEFVLFDGGTHIECIVKIFVHF